jgi:hypothetical protein
VCGQNLPQSIKEQHPISHDAQGCFNERLLLFVGKRFAFIAVNCKFLVSAEPQIKLLATKVLAKYASGLS